MGPKTKELVATLEELIVLLDAEGQDSWSNWMQKSKSWILDSDYSGIEYLLKAYGGMGSFDDLVLGQTNINGMFSWKPGYKDLNTKFSTLSEKAFTLANEIKYSQ